MYDEVMQLIALAKNDEQYFKRIEQLKQMQLELAQVKEIAKTLGEADMHLANARQQAQEALSKAEEEAKEVKAKASLYLEEQINLTASMKVLKDELKQEKENLKKQVQVSKQVELDALASIKEHRELTALRNKEVEDAQKLRQSLESKYSQIKSIFNS